MKKYSIKKIPSWVIWFNILPKNVSCAFTPYVFLSEELYVDYKSGNPGYRTQAIIAHEVVHIKREQEMGLWKFLFFYYFFKKFCLQEEIEAIKEEMKVYKQYGEQFNIEYRAWALSNLWLYHHCISFEDAKNKLIELWNQ